MGRKKKYTYKRKTQVEKEFDAIIGLAVLLWLFIYILQKAFKENFLPYIEKNIIYIYILWLILFLLILLFLFIFYFKYKKNKQLEQDKIDQLPEQVKNIKEKIESFKPLRNYSKEEPYQIELSWYLKNFFPSLDIEISKNYTRPDILIENIAIEIKWPTNFSDLKTIPDKIIRYTKEWDYLIIVLFNLKLHDDIKKSDEIYENWKKDIEESFESKLDRIMFITI